MDFKSLIGKQVVASIPKINVLGDKKSIAVTVEGVETGGLWLRSEAFTQFWLQQSGKATSERTPIIFFPFHAIEYVVSPQERTALSEKAFGLSNPESPDSSDRQ